MENPWSNIGRQGVNPNDRYYIDQHHRSIDRSKPKQKVRSYLPPLPYIGNPLTARVVLLGKNPSFSDVDETDAANIPDIEEENIKSLTFTSDSPFFYLDERFATTNSYKWWEEVLKELSAACKERGVDTPTMLSRIACAQYHPYRSEESFIPKQRFPTQEYTFHLVSEAARDTNKRFIVLYGAVNERSWREAVPNLPTDALRLKSAQNAKITRNNMNPEDFDKLVDLLCAP